MSLALTDQPDSTATQVWKIRSNVAQADVYSVGGALHNLRFSLPDGKQVSPLAEAPWQKNYLITAHSSHPRHIELLGGEWPCVPFGTTGFDPAHHGYGSNNPWQLEQHGDNHVSLSIAYPKGHTIKQLHREIKLPKDELHVEITLGITANQDAVIPIGVHPILNIPQTEKWALVPGCYKYATTSTKPSKAGGSQLVPDAKICDAGHVALRHGKSVDLWKTPSVIDDALIQLWYTDGQFALHDSVAGTTTWVNWNADDLPHCLLWFANPGLSLEKDSDGFRGLGIEPVHANFDGYEGHAMAPVGVKLSAEKTWQTTYQIGCHSL
jgi:galactose mutarotase-like enzyme